MMFCRTYKLWNSAEYGSSFFGIIISIIILITITTTITIIISFIIITSMFNIITILATAVNIRVATSEAESAVTASKPHRSCIVQMSTLLFSFEFSSFIFSLFHVSYLTDHALSSGQIVHPSFLASSFLVLFFTFPVFVSNRLCIVQWTISTLLFWFWVFLFYLFPRFSVFFFYLKDLSNLQTPRAFADLTDSSYILYIVYSFLFSSLTTHLRIILTLIIKRRKMCWPEKG